MSQVPFLHGVETDEHGQYAKQFVVTLFVNESLRKEPEKLV